MKSIYKYILSDYVHVLFFLHTFLGAKFTPKEIIEKTAKKREIVHENTRFHLNPFNSEKNKEILQQVASEKAHANQGKIGHDGKEILTGQTPRVNGYGFVKTPSPAPGMGDESPLMTWGEIEGTPFRLDGTDNTPLPKTPGPTFKVCLSSNLFC